MSDPGYEKIRVKKLLIRSDNPRFDATEHQLQPLEVDFIAFRPYLREEAQEFPALLLGDVLRMQVESFGHVGHR